MTRKPGWPCLLLACSAPLAAQDVATIGRFVDPDGKPIAGASVTFATSHPSVLDALVPPRLVEAVTDASGGFRVRLPQRAEHSLWALGPTEPAGRWRSEVVEGVVAGSVLVLRAKERSAAARIRMTPPPELGPGPFTIEVCGPARHGPTHRVPLGADGTATLPELPAGRTALRLFDAGDRPVVGWFWPNGERTATAAVRHCAVEVVDENGKPVAGAQVAALVSTSIGGGGWYSSGRTIDTLIEGPPTDAAGRSVVVVAEHFVAGFVAWTGDRHARLARRQPQEIVDGALQPMRPDLPADDVPIRLIARTGPVLHGTLRRGTAPLADRRIVAYVDGVCSRQEGGSSASSGYSATYRGRTDASGAFRLPGVARPLQALHLGIETGDEVPTLLLPRPEVPAEPIDIDLDGWPDTTLRLRTGGALPPAASRFLLWPATATHGGAPSVLVGERSGQVRARLEPGSWFVFATDGENQAAKVVDVPSGRDLTVELPAVPLAAMAGRLVDGEGKPVAGVTFSANGYRGDGEEDQDPLAKLLQRHQITINRGLTELGITDAEGRFSVRFLALRGYVPTGMVGGIFGIQSFEFRAAEDLALVWPK